MGFALWNSKQKVFLIIVMSLLWSTCNGGKILIRSSFGGEPLGKHGCLIKALHSHGHTVTVVRTTKSWYIKGDSVYYNTITVPVKEAFDHTFIKPILEKVISLEREAGSLITPASLQMQMFTSMYNMHGLICKMATSMFTDGDLMNRLNKTKYDLVLTDPAWGAGIILAHYLKLPLVYNVRWITSGEGHLTVAPSPLSYIPVTGSGLSDKMTFKQRLTNVMFYSIFISS